MAEDNVIHLEFKSPHVEEDTMAFLACRACKNKTFTLTQDRPGDFPLLRCACCGSHIGRMGWYYDDVDRPDDTVLVPKEERERHREAPPGQTRKP
jgi:hypothetical protein